MDLELLRARVLEATDAFRASLDAILREQEPPPPPEPQEPTWVDVPAGGNLRGALEAGGYIRLETAVYQGPFRITKPTVLLGNGATLRSDVAQPALDIVPEIQAKVFDIEAMAPGARVAVLCGRNTPTEQATIESVPWVDLTKVRVLRHRGKRAIEYNARGTITGCEVADAFSSVGEDNQGLCCQNSPGPINVLGGRYSAGSECILFGGDSFKIPKDAIEDITVADLVLWRPLSWMTDTDKQYVKTSLEFKTGRRVRVRDVHADGCWKDGQDGYALTITPRRASVIEDVEVVRFTAVNCGGGVNISGADDSTYVPIRTNRVRIRESSFDVDTSRFGGRGVLALITMAMRDLTFEHCRFVNDPAAIRTIVADNTSVMLEDRSIARIQEPMGPLTMRQCLVRMPGYGITVGPVHYAGPQTTTQMPLEVTDNVFTEYDARLMRNLPGNRYVTRAEFDELWRAWTPAA